MILNDRTCQSKSCYSHFEELGTRNGEQISEREREITQKNTVLVNIPLLACTALHLPGLTRMKNKEMNCFNYDTSSVN